MLLDEIAAQAVLQAHLLERSVHDPGPWTMSCGDQVAPARRFLEESGVTFLADFHDGLGDDVVVLSCRDDALAVRTVDRAPGAATVRWGVSARRVGSPM